MRLPALPDLFSLSREFFISLGIPGLFAVAFLEFFLLPVPPDLVLIPLTVVRPELGLLYATVATLGSVSAGMIGFIIGQKGGRPALKSRISKERIDPIERYIDHHGLRTLIVVAFAPIPEGFELLSIGAGVFGLSYRTYLIASVIGRGARYLLEAMSVIVIGETAQSFTEVEVYLMLGVASLVVIIGYLIQSQ